MEVRPTAEEPLKVGWREWVGLPEFRVAAIKAKIDTGARTSALHAYRIEPFRRAGALWVRFELQPLQRSQTVRVMCEAPAVDERVVRNSGGGVERRFIVKTLVRLGRALLAHRACARQSRPDGLPHAARPDRAQRPRSGRARPLLSSRPRAFTASPQAPRAAASGEKAPALTTRPLRRDRSHEDRVARAQSEALQPSPHLRGGARARA